METETLNDPGETVQAPSLHGSTDNRNSIRPREWIGVVVVIMFAVVPDLQRAISTYQIVAAGQSLPTVSFADMMYYLIGRSFFVCAITAAAVLMLGRNWKATGFVTIGWGDLLWGVGVYLAGTAVYTAVFWLIPDDWFFRPELSGLLATPKGSHDYPLLLAGSLANGMGEELVVRAYLISRLEALCRSTWFAALATSVMFASYHIYQGPESMIGIFAIGLVYAYVFIRRRSIWPIFIGHALTDFIGLMMLGS